MLVIESPLHCWMYEEFLLSVYESMNGTNVFFMMKEQCSQNKVMFFSFYA